MPPLAIEPSRQLIDTWLPLTGDMWCTCWLHMAATCLTNSGVELVKPSAKCSDTQRDFQDNCLDLMQVASF
jgi:hypothetical protein